MRTRVTTRRHGGVCVARVVVLRVGQKAGPALVFTTAGRRVEAGAHDLLLIGLDEDVHLLLAGEGDGYEGRPDGRSTQEHFWSRVPAQEMRISRELPTLETDTRQGPDTRRDTHVLFSTD